MGISVSAVLAIMVTFDDVGLLPRMTTAPVTCRVICHLWRMCVRTCTRIIFAGIILADVIVEGVVHSPGRSNAAELRE